MEGCPAEEALRQWLEGDSDETADAALSEHLTYCSPCRERLDQLSGAAEMRLSAASSPPTLSESWTTFLRGLAALPPGEGQGRMPRRSPALACPPDYEILGELGRGGMGIVYKARHRKLGRLTALKCLLDPEAGPERRARFLGEAEAAAKLSHPHIVQIYEIAEHAGRTYLALEYISGGSLADLLRQGPVEPAEAARLIEMLARAIHAAHEQGVIHRDLKPANILLAPHRADTGTTGPSESTVCVLRSAAWVPKITDFGLAKRIEDKSGLTQSGEIVGTPEYMAPEQAMGQCEGIGPAADVYALGALLYEMLTRRPPFQGVTAYEVIKQVCSDDEQPTAPKRLNAQTPRDLETICLKCLAKEPHRRYASALALAEDARRFREGRPIEARPAGRLELAAKWARRHRGWAALLGAMMIGLPLLSVLSFLLYMSRDNLESALGRETSLRQRAEDAEKTTREQAHAETVAAARVEAGRGLWDEALRRYDQAIEHDFPDRADLEVERIRCLLPARHRRRLREELDRLKGQQEVAKHRSQLMLYRAVLLLPDQDKFQEGRKLLQEALREPQGLQAADQFYARGLLADSSDEAAAQLRRALQADPFHHPARLALVTEMLITGRYNEVRREAALMRDFYHTDPFPDYVLALAAVMEGQPNVRDRHVEALRPLLEPAHHQTVRRFFTDLAAVLRLAEAIGRGENPTMNGLALAARLPLLQLQWMRGPDPIAMPAPAIARLFGMLDEVVATYRASLFGNHEAAVRRLLAASRRHPEAALLHLAASFEFQRAAAAYRSKKDRAEVRALLKRTRDLAFRAAEAPTLLPKAPFRVEARWLTVMMESLLRMDRADRIRMDAMHVLLAPSSSDPWNIVAATLILVGREPPSDRTDWFREQLHQLAHEIPTNPKLRDERFPLLIQSLDPELALELLRRWQEDEPNAWRLQRLRAETELRAGHHAAALEWAERMLCHPQVSARDRQAMRTLQATTREAIQRLLDRPSSEKGTR